MKRLKNNKDIKSLKIFKNFKKNEIVIYAIALMLVTAGYFNYTANLDVESLETSSGDLQNIATSAENGNNIITGNENEIVQENNQIDENIGDAKLVNSNDVEEDMENSETAEDSKQTDVDKNNNTENSNSEEDYFVSTKLQRDTNYASMISTYTKILEDNSVSETQKSIAMKEITEINDTKNAISVCENLISTKGFDDFVVLVNNDSVNVVVKVEGGLTKDKVAQIQNIISRELNSEIENIHISEK